MRTFKLYYLIVCILSGFLFSQIVTNPFEKINEQYTIGEIYDTVFFVRIDAVAFEEFNKNHTYSLTQMTANLKL